MALFIISATWGILKCGQRQKRLNQVENKNEIENEKINKKPKHFHWLRPIELVHRF